MEGPGEEEGGAPARNKRITLVRCGSGPYLSGEIRRFQGIVPAQRAFGMNLVLHAAASAEAPAQARDLAPVRAWLFALAVLVVAMVAVGGATRLTGSGLSITEWRPVTGAVPPLSEAAWLAEFEKYRQIPQYELVNRGMSLAEFKFIYLWEWSHRQLGRLIGIAFFVPLLWFWARGLVTGRLALALLGIGLLGALQGGVGWIMVASGLEPGAVTVAPVKLTLHLMIASLILASLVWLAVGLRSPRPALLPSREGSAVGGGGAERRDADDRAPRVLRRGAYAVVGLALAQIALGGLVAGSRAGFTYNTWPLIEGRLLPPVATLFSETPWIENFVDNLALVQLNHRLGAYLLVGLAVWHAWRARRLGPSSAARRATALAGLIFGQAAFGVLTLLLVVPIWAGLAHQATAMAVLAVAVAHARLSRDERL
jgi:heme a synthase